MAERLNSPRPSVFTRVQPIYNPKAASVSPKQMANRAKSLDLVVIEINGQIKIVQGICATVVILKAQSEEYKHILHWPEIKNGKIVKRNGYDPNLVVVLSKGEKLSILKGHEAENVIAGEVPMGFEVAFIPQQRKKREKKVA